MKLNQSGQAFSVFKLLIAAIVAVVILSILLQILPDDFIPQGDPTDEASRQVESLIAKLGTPGRTADVTFKPGIPLVAATIATKTGVLDEANVCVIASNSAGNLFENIGGKLINYKGTSSVVRKLYILCDVENKIFSYTIPSLTASVPAASEAFSNAEGLCQVTNSSNRYCVISIVPTGIS